MPKENTEKHHATQQGGTASQYFLQYVHEERTNKTNNNKTTTTTTTNHTSTCGVGRLRHHFLCRERVVVWFRGFAASCCSGPKLGQKKLFFYYWLLRSYAVCLASKDGVCLGSCSKATCSLSLCLWGEGHCHSFFLTLPEEPKQTKPLCCSCSFPSSVWSMAACFRPRHQIAGETKSRPDLERICGFKPKQTLNFLERAPFLFLLHILL